MAEIVHQVGIKGPANEVFRALTTQEGLAKWWTRDTEAEPKIGARLKFRFGGMGPDMEVTELEPQSRVAWKCLSGPPGWVGTQITFDLREEEGRTVVLFGHRNWGESTDFHAHCSTKWATFLLSLKSLVEKGRGTPYPDDVQIDGKC